MTSEITVFNPGTGGFEAAYRMAQMLSTSTMVPEPYRGEANVGNCLIALDIANRLGASPLAIMQHMVPVNGKPSWSATFLIATVNSCGRFTPLRFQMTGDPTKDEWGCRAVATEKVSKEVLTGTLITITMAKAEGWYGKNGSKWKTMPEQMLQYRAAAFWTRTYAPELSLGMQTVDEVIDVSEASPTVTTDIPPPSRRRKQETVAIEQPAAIPVPLARETPSVEPLAVATEPVTAPAEPPPAAAPVTPPVELAVTLLERCETWMSKEGIPYDFVAQKMNDIEAYPNAKDRSLEDLSDNELTLIQRNGRSLIRAWNAKKAQK